MHDELIAYMQNNASRSIANYLKPLNKIIREGCRAGQDLLLAAQPRPPML